MTDPWLQPAWTMLLDRIRIDRVPHAILVQGPRGVGKRPLVAAYARALLCEVTTDAGEPCGSCRGCSLAAAGTHPDYHQIGLEEEHKQLRVDQIRELSRRAGLTSTRGQYQVFVVDPADKMNQAAANAFLKTLEEPTPGSVILLVADRLGQLPATILSRCQRLSIGVPSGDEAKAFLQRNLESVPDDAELLLEAAGGSPGLALEYAQRGLEDDYRQTRADLADLAGGRAGPVEVAERWVEEEPGLRLDWMAALLAEAAWGLARGQESARTLTARQDLVSLTRMLAATHQARRLLDTTLRPELVIESLFINWVAGSDQAGGSPW